MKAENKLQTVGPDKLCENSYICHEVISITIDPSKFYQTLARLLTPVHS